MSVTHISILLHLGWIEYPIWDDSKAFIVIVQFEYAVSSISSSPAVAANTVFITLECRVKCDPQLN